jgi:hypothetical protein
VCLLAILLLLPVFYTSENSELIKALGLALRNHLLNASQQLHDTTRPKIDIITQDTASRAHVSERASTGEETGECCAPVPLAPHQLLCHFFSSRFPSSFWLRFCLSCALQETNPSIHPPAQQSIPTRRRLDPPLPRRLSPGGAAPPPRATRGNQSQAPHTRAPLRRHLRRLLGAECVSCSL